MPLPQDIIAFVHAQFSAEDQPEAFALLEHARTHENAVPEPRLLRCALIASKNTLSDLRHFTNLLALDYRDVIVAGEYVYENGTLTPRWNLSKPFEYANPQPF